VFNEQFIVFVVVVVVVVVVGTELIYISGVREDCCPIVQ
jgi:hypothetical protein